MIIDHARAHTPTEFVPAQRVHRITLCPRMTDLNLMQEAPLWKDLYLPQVADVVGVHRKIIVPAS